MRLPHIAPHVLRHRWVLLALLTSLSALSLWGLLGESGAWGGGGEEELSPEESLYEEMGAELGVDHDACLLVVEGDDLLGPEQVAIVRKLVARLEALPVVRDVPFVDDVPSFADGPQPAPLLPVNGAGPAAFRRAKPAVLAHPLVGGHLLTPDERAWVLPVLFEADAHTAGHRDAAREVEEALAGAKLSSSMRATLTGTAPLRRATEETFAYEQWLFHGAAYVLTFVLAAFLFRSVWAVILTGGGPLLGVLWTFGILRLYGEHLNGLTRVILPVMIMMIGFTDSVHLMIHVRRERRRGLDPRAAADSAVRALLLPCWLTSFTTALGFASLLTARTELIQKFGFASTIGALCTFLAVLTFLPFFASTRLGRYLVERESSVVVESTLPAARGFVAWVLRHARAVTAAGVLVTLVCLAIGVGVENDNRVRSDLPESSPAAQVLRRLDASLGGTVPISVYVEWDEARAGDWPAILAAVGAARAGLEGLPAHSRPLDLTDLLAALPGAPGGDLAERVRWLPLTPAHVRERVLSEDGRVARVEALLPDVGYERLQPEFDALRAELAGLESAHPGFRFHLTGQAIVSGFLFGEVSRDLVLSLGLASLTIFAVLAFAFHSLRLGLVSIVPNAFPLAMTAALLVLLDIPMAGATAFVMSLGIAVDDTIHLVARFRRELGDGAALPDAVEQAVIGVGKALLLTTVVLVIGFAPVLTSDFPRNRVFAGMIMVTVAAALVGDLLILPAMLRLFGVPRSLRRARGADQ
ncbi:MAG: MMPL family transporter [Planctomycetes bacterium]|nr:MMPL family transporter [Planctomycetota bacterium]